MTTTLFRSMLFVPGNNARALEKSAALAADALIYDLEDSVDMASLGAARAAIGAALSGPPTRAHSRLVRVHDIHHPEFKADCAFVGASGADAVLIPKVNTRQDVDMAAEAFGTMPIWCMVETPLAVVKSFEIAEHPSVRGLIVGPNDLSKDLRIRPTADRATLLTALQTTVLAARAAGIFIIDGVFNQFRDADGYRAECEQGRDLGFDGKSLIHPAQIDPANAVFRPSAEEIEAARVIISAFETAEAEGKSVAVVDGAMVEALHVKQARALLELDAALNAEDNEGTA